MGRLEGKSAIITGAASGIGEATALRFSREGASVLVTDLNQGPVDRVVAAIQREGGSAAGRVLDVAVAADRAAGVAAALQAFGKIDILVNNAGMSSSLGGAPELWDKGIEVSLSSVYWMSLAALPHLQATRGNIVNLASSAGNTIATPVAWYCSAKAALAGLTRSFAVTYGPEGIRTNAVAPGSAETPRVRELLDRMPGQREKHNNRCPLRRMGTAEEQASVVLFLASDDAAFVTGQTIFVDGGFSLAL
jgi:meso-butanediol dehydrogenase/(S,S)-butanediol dehydrogenase/diacetyl reductase